MPTIPTDLAVVLPIFGMLISGWLKQNKALSPGANALIALFALIIFAVLCELLSGDIPVTWPLRLAGVLVYIGVLMHGDLSTLANYLEATPSPIATALGLSTDQPTSPEPTGMPQPPQA